MVFLHIKTNVACHYDKYVTNLIQLHTYLTNRLTNTLYTHYNPLHTLFNA